MSIEPFNGTSESAYEVDITDLGLFHHHKPGEPSQYDKARTMVTQVTDCMLRAVRMQDCVLPRICSMDDDKRLEVFGYTDYKCAHLHVGISMAGMALPQNRYDRLFARVRLLGARVAHYSHECTDEELEAVWEACESADTAAFAPLKANMGNGWNHSQRVTPASPAQVGWFARLFR